MTDPESPATESSLSKDDYALIEDYIDSHWGVTGEAHAIRRLVDHSVALQIALASRDAEIARLLAAFVEARRALLGYEACDDGGHRARRWLTGAGLRQRPDGAWEKVE